MGTYLSGPPGYAVLEHNPEHKHLLLNPGGHPGACGAGGYVVEGIYMGVWLAPRGGAPINPKHIHGDTEQ